MADTKSPWKADAPYPAPEPSAPLREIGARISKLSFRDMLALAEIVRENIGGRTVLESTPALATALLAAADTLSKA